MAHFSGLGTATLLAPIRASAQGSGIYYDTIRLGDARRWIRQQERWSRKILGAYVFNNLAGSRVIRDRCIFAMRLYIYSAVCLS